MSLCHLATSTDMSSVDLFTEAEERKGWEGGETWIVSVSTRGAATSERQ